MFNEDTPFGAWGGMPGTTGTGFSKYLADRGNSNEEDILKLLPKLDKVQQVETDIKLNNNAIDIFPNHKSLLSNDIRWKYQLIDAFKGRVIDPRVINSLIEAVKRGLKSHQNRVASQLTGSDRWNATWIEVYEQWLRELHKIGDS